MEPLHDLIDAHCHLQEPKLWHDRVAVLSQVKSAGVSTLLCNGTHEADWQHVTELVNLHPYIIPCYGIHPWFVQTCSDTWLQQLETLLQNNPHACIGEIGLDHWIHSKPYTDQNGNSVSWTNESIKENERMQEQVFLAQLELARTYNRPVTVHCLKAWPWLDTILKTIGSTPLPKRGGILHAYGGSPEQVPHWASLGFSFSFGAGILDDKRTKLHNALRAVPLESLFLESDAPDIPPRNLEWHTPATMPRIYSKAAELLHLPVEELAEQIRSNLQHLLA